MGDMNSEERRSAWTALSELRQRGHFQLSPAGRPGKQSTWARSWLLVDV